jgi:hypothetical protein
MQAAVCCRPFATPLEDVFGLSSANPAFIPESAPAGMQQYFSAPQAGRSATCRLNRTFKLPLCVIMHRQIGLLGTHREGRRVRSWGGGWLGNFGPEG